MTIKAKIILFTVVLMSATSFAISFIITASAITDTDQALQRSSEARLVAARNATAERIEDYFATIRDQAITFSSDLMIIDALKTLTPAFQLASLETDATPAQRDALASFYREEYDEKFQQINNGESSNPEALVQKLSAAATTMQHAYIAANPSPLGEKDRMNSANTGSEYDRLHSRYHPAIRQYLQHFGYYDIFLVDAASGVVVYSVFKELDYATSLRTGPYANSGLGKAFNAALQATDANQTFLTDFNPYAPSYNAPAAFMSSPVYDGGKLLGVLIFQMPIERINNIMTHNQHWAENGLGESGETYLLGDDGLMRSDGRFLIEDKAGYLKLMAELGMPKETITQIDQKQTTIGLQSVVTEGARRAIAGEKGFAQFNDYRGVPVLSAFRPLEIPGLNWVLMSEIDQAEALIDVINLKDRLITRGGTIALIALGIGVALAIWAASFLIGMINHMTTLVAELGDGRGDLTKRIPHKGNDELAKLASEFNRFIDYLDNTFSTLLGSIVRLVPIAEDQKKVISDLNDSIEQQRDSSQKVNASMIETNQSTASVSQALNDINAAARTGDSTVANSSVVVRHAAGAIVELVTNMDKAVGALSALQEDTDRIVSVVDVINGIAEQTNLLALNAAIEAARAGEAGRGFAVVADEVRSLAFKTRQSTEEVSNMVHAIQSGTRAVVETMQSGKANAEQSSGSMNNAMSELDSINQAMSSISGQVIRITQAIELQRRNYDTVNHQYERMSQSFDSSQIIKVDAETICEDINRLGSKLSGMVSQFKVSDNNFSTKRRTKVREIKGKNQGSALT